MKKLFYVLMLPCILLATFSCSDDSDDNPPAATAVQIRNTLLPGTWKITLFSEDGVNQTTNFSGYNFDFNASDVLLAENGTNNYAGTWTITVDDDSPGKLDFNIAFAGPNNFSELSEDWDIVQRTDTKLVLRHVSGGDGDIDLLTFEKN